MTYISAVTGNLTATSREDIILQQTEEAQRALLAEEAKRLGGSIVFDLPLGGFSKKAFDKIQRIGLFSALPWFFDITSTGLTSLEKRGRAGGLKSEIKNLVEIAEEDNVDLNGYILVNGEDHNDIWGILVEDNEVEIQRATVTWPDNRMKAWLG